MLAMPSGTTIDTPGAFAITTGKALVTPDAIEWPPGTADGGGEVQ
jgi:hypothetical protein